MHSSSLFLKTYLSTLLPYPSNLIIKETDINKEEFNKNYKKFDFAALESKKKFLIELIY